MLRSVTISLYTVTVLSVLFHLLSAACYAQDAKDWYALAGAALEGYKRQAVEYGPSQEDALDKAARDCSEYATQINLALHQAFTKEHYDCRADDNCDKRARDKLHKKSEEIFDELEALCDQRELAIRFHYLEQRMEQAKRQYKEEVDRINKELASLVIEELKENAWHALRDTVIASEENAEKKAFLRHEEDIRHRQRLAEINTSRERLRGDLQQSQKKLEEEFKKN